MESIRQAAETLYSTALPYHNFGHALAVAREAERIIVRCRQDGVPVDADVVQLAAWFHDAGYHEDHADLGFPTKEAYSAELARRELRKQGVAQGVIDQVCEAILCTHYDGICRNNESKVVRAADLAGLAAEYRVFKRNSLRLKQEHELMSRKRVSWSDWRRMAADNAELYLRQELSLTPDAVDENGQSRFISRSRENLRRLKSDSTDDLNEGN